MTAKNLVSDHRALMVSNYPLDGSEGEEEDDDEVETLLQRVSEGVLPQVCACEGQGALCVSVTLKLVGSSSAVIRPRRSTP